MLDKAPGLTPTSRLGCQAVVEDPYAEITVVIPRSHHQPLRANRLKNEEQKFADSADFTDGSVLSSR